MDSFDFWRLCDQLTVVQAALLMVGHNPGDYIGPASFTGIREAGPEYFAALTALQHAVLSEKIKAEIVHLPLEWDDPRIHDSILRTNWESTRIEVVELREWMLSRGISKGFFFPDRPVTAEYLDPAHPQFSPKLAAAVAAWNAVRTERASNPSTRSVKQDLTRWLNVHAAAYGLVNEEGEPNKLAVDEVAKVANWNPKGGAPKTPGDPERYSEE